MTEAPRTAVVHLVRQANGPQPLDTFLSSYEACPAGEQHELVLLLKGFASAQSAQPFLDRAAAHAPHHLHVGDAGMDLTAYRAAAARLSHERVCFLNSFSEVRAPGWLGLLAGALEDGSAGAAGATGSWASLLAYELWQLGLRRSYAGVLRGRRPVSRAMYEVAGVDPPGDLRAWALTLLEATRHARAMGPFPAPHLRTNGFLMDRRLFLTVCAPGHGSKTAMFAVESGRRSLTAQLEDQGRPPVVVDRHGAARPPARWPDAEIFWQGSQTDLLISDNQTRNYELASPRHREVLSRVAWGARAAP